MRKHDFKTFRKMLFLIVFSLSSAFCFAEHVNDRKVVIIVESSVQGAPKGSSIEATIDGHILSVVFLENLGQVSVEICSANGGHVDTLSTAM